MIINSIINGSGGETAEIFVIGLSETDTVTCTKDGKMKQGKWTSKTNPAISVPAGYTQLKYIESSGTQYIDTGISAPNGFKAVIDWEFKSLNQYANVIGADNGSSGFNFLCVGSPSSYYWQLGTDSSKDSSVKSAVNTRYNIDVSTVINHSYLKINDVTLLTDETSTSRSSRELFIFAVNSGGEAKFFSSAKIYLCKIINNNSVVRDYIPAKRNSDGVVGLYDLVSKTFFTNVGTGIFTAGSEIPSIISCWLFDKLKSYGTYTITASNSIDTTTQDVLVDMATEFDIEMSYKLYLYNLGDECESVTGGWKQGTYYTNAEATKNDNNLYLHSYRAIFMTNNKINLTNYEKLKMHIANCTSRNDNKASHSLMIGDNNSISNGAPSDWSDWIKSEDNSSGELIMTLNISSVNTPKYISILCDDANYSAYMYVDKIWLE